MVDHKNKATSIATIRNNADTELSLEVEVPPSPGVQVEIESEGPLAPGGETDLTATCGSGGDPEESQVTVDVRSAESSDLSVYNASRTITVQLDCSGGGNSGFKSVSADDIQTGDSEQTFRFEPQGNLKKGEVRIDLSDPSRNGVEYDQNPTARNNGGSAERDGDEIVFTPPNSGAKGVVEITIGVSAPSGSTGTYDVSYTRTDKDRTAWTSFSVS